MAQRNVVAQKSKKMIAKETIDKVFEVARVEEVIGDFVHLKRSGVNYKGLSPFSNEKTPSFVVSPSKNIWKDFSSGKGGNAVSFVMEHEHFSFLEAIRYLAKKYGIEVVERDQTDEEKVAQNDKESMYILSDFAMKYFEDQLWNTEEGRNIAYSYFKERGFTDETIKTFRLGYSPDQWEAFTSHALKNQYQLEFLDRTGLTVVKENKQFDRFKGRVMFPILSMSGRVLGFGGRILTNEKNAAKYLNSPESEIYHKSKILYGFYQAKQAIAKADKCYLVEGYTDVIQFYQSGVQNVVASSGTALTVEQIRLINRLTQNITVLFDGDAAGLKASLRGIDMILEEGMNVRVCTFPEGEDPDSMAKKLSFEELQNYLNENETDFINFKAKLLTQEAGQDPIKKAEVTSEIVQSIAKIPNPIQQEIYIKSCASTMDVSERVLFASLAQILKKQQDKANKKYVEEQRKRPISLVAPPDKINPIERLEKEIVSLILIYGNQLADFEEYIFEVINNRVVEKKVYISRLVIDHIYMNLQNDEIEFSTSFYRDFYQDIIRFYQESGAWNTTKYLAQAKPEFIEEASGIILNNEKESLHQWDRKKIFVKTREFMLPEYVFDTILNYRLMLVSEQIEQQKELTKDPEIDAIEVLEHINKLFDLRKLFSTKLNRIVM